MLWGQPDAQFVYRETRSGEYALRWHRCPGNAEVAPGQNGQPREARLLDFPPLKGISVQ